MVQLEAMVDTARYSLRLQLSTPQLDSQVVWSPSVFVSTPDRGQGEEEEVVRAFFSLLQEHNDFLLELAFSTLGTAAEIFDFNLLCMFSSLVYLSI